MTPDGLRRIALSMPEAVEASHVGHPDFRVAGRIFATLGYPDARWAMIKLKPKQQAKLVDADPISPLIPNIATLDQIYITASI